KRLRIELRRERLDLHLVDRVGSARESLSDMQVVQVKTIALGVAHGLPPRMWAPPAGGAPFCGLPGLRRWESRPGIYGSGADKGQQVGIDHVCVHRAHAVRKARIDLERAILEQLGLHQ